MAKYAAVTDAQQALVTFCSAARAIRETTTQNASEKKRLRAVIKQTRTHLLEQLTRLGDDNACVTLPMPDGDCMYARAVTRKGGQKRITADGTVEAIKSIDVFSDVCDVAGVLGVVVQHFTGDSKVALSITKTQRGSVRVLDAPGFSNETRQLGDCVQRLKTLTGRERDTCAPLKERCQATKPAVVQHLQAHDPTGLTQVVKLAVNGEESRFKLRAKPKTKATPRKDVVRALESILVAEDQKRGARPFVAHLQDPSILARVRDALKAQLEAKGDVTMDVSLVPTDA